MPPQSKGVSFFVATSIPIDNPRKVLIARVKAASWTVAGNFSRTISRAPLPHFQDSPQSPRSTFFT